MMRHRRAAEAGHLQPHGILLHFTTPDLRVAAVSVNAAHYFGTDARSLLNCRVDDLFDTASSSILKAASANGATDAHLVRLRLQRFPKESWNAFVHRMARCILLDLKLPQPLDDLATSALIPRQQAAARRLQSASNLTALCGCLAEEVYGLTSYARVTLCRFGADWNQRMLAEVKTSALPSSFGQNFPGAEIPAEVRAFYARNPDRHIPDVGYVGVPLVASDPGPIDVGDSTLCGVPPTHLQELRSRGVAAALTISIMLRNTLWGLLVCHNPDPLYVAPEVRQIARQLAQQASARIGTFQIGDVDRGA